LTVFFGRRSANLPSPICGLRHTHGTSLLGNDLPLQISFSQKYGNPFSFLNQWQGEFFLKGRLNCFFYSQATLSRSWLSSPFFQALPSMGDLPLMQFGLEYGRSSWCFNSVFGASPDSGNRLVAFSSSRWAAVFFFQSLVGH